MNNQGWTQQPYGIQNPTQSYPNEPPPSYEVAMGQASPETAPPGTYKIPAAPTAPPVQVALPYIVSEGHIYNFPHNNEAQQNHLSQPPGTQQIIMAGTPVPPSDGPLIITQQKSNTKRTCSGVCASLVVLFILLWILFKFFIRVY